MYRSEFNIFAQSDLSQVLEQRTQQLKVRIDGEQPTYILNVNEGEYVAHLISDFEIEPIQLQVDKKTASSREELIEAERFPQSFYVRSGGKYPKTVITYHVPFTGDAELLKCKPGTWMMSAPKVFVEGGCICFDIINWSDNADEIRRSADNTINTISSNAHNVSVQVSNFNSQLPTQANALFLARREQLKKQNSVLLDLGVPIRKSANFPESFAVPVARKKVIVRPVAPPTAGKPVPTLDDPIYEDILKTIHETGKVFERYPSTYTGKDEESLRDHLIMQLEPRFEGSTTGETFNKKGKTDILIRHEKKNVFVAECKFWGGKSMHAKTIDQLLSYLTWRDSKTAIVYFVNRKEIMPVLTEIAASSAAHGCFVKDLGTKDASWQNFEFCLPSDRDCKLRLAILAFHIP
jgi:hypothetical protein